MKEGRGQVGDRRSAGGHGGDGGRPRRRDGRPQMRGGRATLGAWVAAAALVACGGETGQAQGVSVLPSDPEVLVQRADQARVKGEAEDAIRLVEVSDFQCPFCAQYYADTYPALDSLYVSTGKVNYIWIAFANPTHRLAWPSIEAAFCAGGVGKFWPMHDLLFQRQGTWSEASDPFATFLGYAEELEIDRDSFADCMRNDRMAPLIIRDYQNAVRAGINSTPYFILADSVAIRGAAPLENFTSAIDDLLEASGNQE